MKLCKKYVILFFALFCSTIVFIPQNNAQIASATFTSVICASTTTFPTKLALNFQFLELETNESEQLIASILPDNATNQMIKWSSTNPKVAKVDINGVVTGVCFGKTTIVAETANGIKALCVVTISALDPLAIDLNVPEKVIHENKTFQLKVSYSPYNAYSKKLTWKSSHPSVATVSSTGIVTGKKSGSATITVTAVNGLKAKCNITVKSIPIKKLKAKWQEKTILVGNSYTLSVQKTPANATDTLKWSSNASSIASVSQTGKIIAKKAGKATITVKSASGKKAKCIVIVKKNTRPNFIAKQLGKNQNQYSKRVAVKIKNNGTFPMKILQNAYLCNYYSTDSLGIYLCNASGFLLSSKQINARKTSTIYFTYNNSIALLYDTFTYISFSFLYNKTNYLGGANGIGCSEYIKLAN